MMDSEELQSDLLALRKLYGLLINDEQYGADAGSSENLDKNARQLLLSLLNSASNNAFEAHAKMLGTQYTTSNNPWTTPQEQLSDGIKLQPFSVTNAPTSFPSVQQVDLMTGDGIFNDPTNQFVFSAQPNNGSTDEYGIRLKRCRVCQKQKVKQLTKEVSIQDRNVLTLNSISQQQNHKRSWEVQNDMSGVENSACTSNSPLPFDYIKSLALINLTDEENEISREASTKILQIESCISSLQAVVKPVNLIDTDYESQPSQRGQIGNFVMGRSDPNNGIKGRRTWNPTNELTLQSQPFDTRTMYAMRQTAENVGLENQHNHMPEETYNHFHSGGVTSNSNRNHSLYREQMYQKEMAEKEAMRGSEIIQWSNSPARTTVHGRHDYEYQEAVFMKQKKHGKTYKDQMDHYKGTRGKHEMVEPISMVSPSSQSISDSPVSSSNFSSSLESQSQTESQSQQSSTGDSDSEGSSREVYSGSGRSGDSEESESEMYSFSSQEDKSPDTSSSSESLGSKTETKAKTKSWLSKTLPTKGHESGTKKEPDISSSSESSVSKSKSKSKLRKTVSIKGHKSGNKITPDMSSSSESSGPKSISKSRETVPKKGHKSGDKKTPSVSSSSESSGSKSKIKLIVPTKGNKTANKKDPNMSSSSESSGSNSQSRKTVPTKDHKNDNKKELKTSSSVESSGSKLKLTKTIPTKDHKSANKKELKVSSSSESSGSKSRKVAAKDHKNDNKKELKMKQVGRLKKLKDKLSVIFHHHHHHYHHHHHPDDKDHHHHPDDKDHHHHPDNKDHHKKSIWAKAGKALVHSKKKDEAYGEQAVNKIQSKAIVVYKAGDKKQKGNLKALVGGVGGLLKHATHSKKSKKSKGALTKIPSRKSGENGGGKVGKKMQWWKMLQHQRKIERIDKLRGKIAK